MFYTQLSVEQFKIVTAGLDEEINSNITAVGGNGTLNLNSF